MAIRHSTPADGTFSPAGKAAWDADHDGDASDLSYTASGTGATARTVANRLGEYVSAFDFIPSAEHAAIIAESSTTDVTAYLQAAIDTGKNVVFPAGAYKAVGDRKSVV